MDVANLMVWLSIIGNALYYLALPISYIFSFTYSWLLVILKIILSPVLQLWNSIISGLILPLNILAKFETVLVFLGSAALVGLISGSILHVSSGFLVSLFNLTSTTEESGRSAASVRAARAQRTVKQDPLKWKIDPSVEKIYAEWLKKDGGRRKEEQGLLAQTIIEEDDDSEAGF